MLLHARAKRVAPLVAYFIELAAPWLEVAVEGGGVGRVLEVVAHLVAVPQQDDDGVPLPHHLSENIRTNELVDFQQSLIE